MAARPDKASNNTMAIKSISKSVALFKFTELTVNKANKLLGFWCILNFCTDVFDSLSLTGTHVGITPYEGFSNINMHILSGYSLRHLSKKCVKKRIEYLLVCPSFD